MKNSIYGRVLFDISLPIQRHHKSQTTELFGPIKSDHIILRLPSVNCEKYFIRPNVIKICNNLLLSVVVSCHNLSPVASHTRYIYKKLCSLFLLVFFYFFNELNCTKNTMNQWLNDGNVDSDDIWIDIKLTIISFGTRGNNNNNVYKNRVRTSGLDTADKRTHTHTHIHKAKIKKKQKWIELNQKLNNKCNTMVLHTFDMNMQSLADKKITICLVLFLLELFLDGELSWCIFIC